MIFNNNIYVSYCFIIISIMSSTFNITHFCDDILNIIFNYSNNYSCGIVCKKWLAIILKKSEICCTCKKIVKMYDNTLWFTYDTNICHGYYDTLQKYNIYKNILMYDKDCTFFRNMKRQSVGLCAYSIEHSKDKIKFIKNMTNQLLEIIVQQHGFNFEYDYVQTESLCLIAIKHDYKQLQHVINQTDEMCRIAICNNALALQYVHNQTDELCVLAMSRDIYLFHFIKNPTYSMCKEAIIHNKYNIDYIPKIHKTEELYLLMIHTHSNALKLIKNQTDKLCLEAVKKCSTDLQYVINKTQEICYAAVNKNGNAIQYVPFMYMDLNLCNRALKYNGVNIAYIPESYITYDMCMQSIINNGLLEYIPLKYRTEELCLQAVKKIGGALLYVPNEYKTENMCFQAIKQDCNSIRYANTLPEDQLVNILLSLSQ